MNNNGKSAVDAVPADQITLPLAAPRVRIESIDMLRGLAIVLMALDHTRDFFYAAGMSPRDVTQPMLFMTRWITNFCAPAFIMLAGVSAYLYGSGKGRSKNDLSRFLLIRGFWIILMEFTIVKFGWTFSFDINLVFIQVMWAIGISMIVMAALIHLPRMAIAVFGVAMIAGHNFLNGIDAESFGAFNWVWHLLHQPVVGPALINIGPEGRLLGIIYPVIPWPGIMAVGYALGPVFKLEPSIRRRFLLRLGTAITAGFFLLRATNLYGDPVGWTVHGSWLSTVLSFLNCEKYPPSLLYLMITLGPALIMLALFERLKGRFAGIITAFGRVPFLFYVIHLPFIHILAVAFAWFTIGNVDFLFDSRFIILDKPAGYGVGLLGVYIIWLIILAALYPLCRWFGGLKQRRRDWWLSYL